MIASLATVARLRLQAVAQLLAAQPEPAAQAERDRYMWRLAYDAGRADGWDRGRRALLAHLAAVERYHYTLTEGTFESPDFAELDLRRWGPGGRAHFADPRPGDYPGRATIPST